MAQVMETQVGRADAVEGFPVLHTLGVDNAT
jgi:hypothetical protein